MLLDSGCQLLQMDMARSRLHEVRESLRKVVVTGSVLANTVAVLVAAADQRLWTPCQFTATNLEAAAEVADMYVEFNDVQCFTNEKFYDMDSRAAHSSANSVVPDAKSSSCCRTSCTASTGNAFSLEEVPAARPIK